MCLTYKDLINFIVKFMRKLQHKVTSVLLLQS